jgi:uncharacterized protein with HEPN domain
MIVKFCKDIEGIVGVRGSGEADFEEDLSLQYSCVFAITQIGEYVKRLSSELRDETPEIDWKGITGMQDIIVHDYSNIDVPRVRMVILERITPLKEKCRSLLDSFRE